MSKNDVEKTFNYLCLQLLTEQTDEMAKYNNVARAWGVFKSAIRLWFQDVLSKNSDYYYRVFIKDIQKGASSKLRPAITKALIGFKPIAQEILKEKKRKQEEQGAIPFEIREQYDFTDDYEPITPQKLCALDQCFVPISYKGKDNEKRFIDYLESKDKYIEWWFKNGSQGKDYFAIKYYNSTDGKEELFYPDWIIKFKDGRVGIYDTKAGQTAQLQETADKAKALALKLEKLGNGYVGGIVVLEGGMWYYSNSEDYSYYEGNAIRSRDWKPLERLFTDKK
jgi:type III restriction enzyme